ncbi:MAG TPA: DUF1800 domain-containing protein [Terriglobales bacterium]|nr:DUF1800 domain-containing protein [Terriglobales bacterium]
MALALLLLSCLTAVSLSASKKAASPKRTLAPLTQEQRAIHLLNRLTFGPRPGDLDHVLQVGMDKWIDQQLHPDAIDDSALNARLGPLRTLRMTPKELVQSFPNPGMIKAVAEGKAQPPNDPLLAMIYRAQITRLQRQNQQRAAAAAAMEANGKTDDEIQRDQQKQMATALAKDLLAMPKEQRIPTLEGYSGDQLLALGAVTPGDLRDKLNIDFTPEQREAFQALGYPPSVAVNELQQAKLLRAIYSERQLQEVMTDFWFNHFNVYVNKDADQHYTTSFERDVIRPHALGKFRELLIATAQNPAMLFYLDNWTSIGPDSKAAGANNKAPDPRRGLNENYARELMELHTLSVDGGYTQSDVTELAKVLTGWTIDSPAQGGGFAFDARKHQPGDKYVLGVTIHENGQQEGLEMLNKLADSPQTAHFIAKKLAQRFVADDPPPAFINRLAERFLEADGDIREVLKQLFASSEFWSPQSYRTKVKTPLEFVVSAVRASGADVTHPGPLIQALGKMGEPLYQAQPPTGYSMRADYWINSSALLDRLNFAIQMSNGEIGGLKFDAPRLLSLGVLTDIRLSDARAGLHDAELRGADRAMTLLEWTLLEGEVSKQTQNLLEQRLIEQERTTPLLRDPAKGLATIAGILLGSPEFQKR